MRQIRGEMDIAPSRKFDVLLQNAGSTDLEYLARNRAYLTRLAGIARRACSARARPRRSPRSPSWGRLEILVPDGRV